MVTGPVDIVIIGFPGNRFSGGVAPAIERLVASGTIRIIDLLFVMVDEDGAISSLRVQDLDSSLDPGLVSLQLSDPGSLDHEDAEELVEDLPRNSSALLVAFENTWAAEFVSEVRASDAVVIDQIRIPADAVAAYFGS